METQIQSYIQSESGPIKISVFGYATRGVPSLEINGASINKKLFKEKLIYLTRSRSLKIPRRRYVLCIDFEESTHTMIKGQALSLELPLLLLYWHLAGLIPLRKLDNCICMGQVNINGVIRDQLSDFLDTNDNFEKNKIYLTEKKKEGVNTIAFTHILSHIDKLIFK